MSKLEKAKEILKNDVLKMDWEWILGQLQRCNYSVLDWTEEEKNQALFTAHSLAKWFKETQTKQNLLKVFFENIFEWLKNQNEIRPEFMSVKSPAWKWFNTFCRENLDGDWIPEPQRVKAVPKPQSAGIGLPTAQEEEELAFEIADEEDLSFVEALPIAKKRLMDAYEKKMRVS